MYQSRVIEEFPLPAECQADYCTIDRDRDGQLHATPYMRRSVTSTDSTDRYDEPDRDEWSPGEKYRQAIAERSDHAIEEIQIERNWTEPEVKP